MSKYTGNRVKSKSCNVKKAIIPVRLIKENKDLFCHFIYQNFNNLLFISKFSKDLKKADVLPIHKKKDKY